jgi:hypothetical protein
MGGKTSRLTDDAVSPAMLQARAAAQEELKQLAGEVGRLHQRMVLLRALLRSIPGGTDEILIGTYAEAATSLLVAAQQPMTVPELVDALAAAGRPVNGPTRQHQRVTLGISLRRERSLRLTSRGYWLRGVPMPKENAHGS